MTHQQILDKLAARHLVKSIEEDLSRLTFNAMCSFKDIAEQKNYILPLLLLRWNCILEEDSKEGVADIYKQKTILALAVLLHKFGFKEEWITDKALSAINDLNKGVVLSDDFYRKSEEIKKVLISDPVVLKRKPSVPDGTTFYREKDVISIQIEKKYYAAYVHSLAAPNESPIIEFYDKVFDKIPVWEEVKTVKAKGELFNDGIERISLFSVSGMKFLPDLANQVKLIEANVKEIPKNDHLVKRMGLYIVSDIVEIQTIIQEMFR